MKLASLQEIIKNGVLCGIVIRRLGYFDVCAEVKAGRVYPSRGKLG